MALNITHPFNSSITDSPAALFLGKVTPSRWNNPHDVSGTLDSSQISGTLLSSQYIAPGFIHASSNLVYYVNGGSGSDTNPGSAAAPFATITRALNEVIKYDYQQQYSPTINISSGEYAERLKLPELYNINIFSGGVIAGAGESLTTLWDSAGSGLITAYGTGAKWNIRDLTTDSARYHIYASHLAQLSVSGNVTLADRSNNLTEFFNAFDGGHINITFSHLTITTSAYFAFFLGGGTDSGMTGLLGSITLPSVAHGSSTNSAWLDTSINGTANFFFYGVTYTNSSLFEGKQVRIDGSGGTTILTSDGTLSQFPGISSNNGIDSVCSIAAYAGNGTYNTFGIKTSSNPTSDDVLPNTWAVVNNESDGSIRIYFNSSGTLLKSAALTP